MGRRVSVVLRLLASFEEGECDVVSQNVDCALQGTSGSWSTIYNE
jgi:hypothetical protein